jgi:hypothetical protein
VSSASRSAYLPFTIAVAASLLFLGGFDKQCSCYCFTRLRSTGHSQPRQTLGHAAIVLLQAFFCFIDQTRDIYAVYVSVPPKPSAFSCSACVCKRLRLVTSASSVAPKQSCRTPVKCIYADLRALTCFHIYLNDLTSITFTLGNDNIKILQ